MIEFFQSGEGCCVRKEAEKDTLFTEFFVNLDTVTRPVETELVTVDTVTSPVEPEVVVLLLFQRRYRITMGDGVHRLRNRARPVIGNYGTEFFVTFLLPDQSNTESLSLPCFNDGALLAAFPKFRQFGSSSVTVVSDREIE